MKFGITLLVLIFSSQSYACFNGVDMLDTAISYGEAQSSLGLVGVKKFGTQRSMKLI